MYIIYAIYNIYSQLLIPAYQFVFIGQAQDRVEGQLHTFLASLSHSALSKLYYSISDQPYKKCFFFLHSHIPIVMEDRKKKHITGVSNILITGN